MATGRRERQWKRFTQYLLPKSQHNLKSSFKNKRETKHLAMLRIKKLWIKSCPMALDEPANPDISKSCRSSLVTCVVHPCINVQNSGGQTCSMYEPHIVKPTLQKAATLKFKTTNLFAIYSCVIIILFGTTCKSTVRHAGYHSTIWQYFYTMQQS